MSSNLDYGILSAHISPNVGREDQFNDGSIDTPYDTIYLLPIQIKQIND